MGSAPAQRATKNKEKREIVFITAFYNEDLNLVIMDDPEKFIAIKPADRDLRFPDHNAFVSNAGDLIHHHDKRLMYPCIFSRRQLLPDGLHAQFGENGSGRRDKVDLYIISKAFYIKQVMDKQFRQLVFALYKD